MGRRFTVRLGADAAEAVVDEAERRDRSQAYIVREAVEAQLLDAEGSDDASDSTTGDDLDAERLDDIAERLAAIEASLNQQDGSVLVNDDADGAASVADVDSAAATERDSKEKETDGAEGSDGAAEPASAAATPTPDAENRPSSGPESEPADVVAYVREHQPISRGDIVDSLFDESEHDIQSDSWWRRHARPELNDAGAEFVRNQGWQFACDDDDDDEEN